MNHAPCAGLITGLVDQQPRAVLLYDIYFSGLLGYVMIRHFVDITGDNFKVVLCQIYGVLGQDSAYICYTGPGSTWAKEMNFVMNHASGTGPGDVQALRVTAVNIYFR